MTASPRSAEAGTMFKLQNFLSDLDMEDATRRVKTFCSNTPLFIYCRPLTRSKYMHIQISARVPVLTLANPGNAPARLPGLPVRAGNRGMLKVSTKCLPLLAAPHLPP